MKLFLSTRYDSPVLVRENIALRENVRERGPGLHKRSVQNPEWWRRERSLVQHQRNVGVQKDLGSVLDGLTKMDNSRFY